MQDIEKSCIFIESSENTRSFREGWNVHLWRWIFNPTPSFTNRCYSSVSQREKLVRIDPE